MKIFLIKSESCLTPPYASIVIKTPAFAQKDGMLDTVQIGACAAKDLDDDYYRKKYKIDLYLFSLFYVMFI